MGDDTLARAIFAADPDNEGIDFDACEQSGQETPMLWVQKARHMASAINLAEHDAAIWDECRASVRDLVDASVKVPVGAGTDGSVSYGSEPMFKYEGRLMRQQLDALQNPYRQPPAPVVDLDVCGECGHHHLTTGEMAMSHADWVEFNAWLGKQRESSSTDE